MSALADKIAIVTGASRGIGRAVAEDLAAAGATVVINYRSNADAAAEVVAGIVGNGGTAVSQLSATKAASRLGWAKRLKGQTSWQISQP